MQVQAQLAHYLAENERLYQEARAAEERERQHTRRVHVLAEAARAFVAAQPDLDNVLSAAAEAIASSVGDGCAILMLSENERWLQPAAVDHSDRDVRGLARTMLAPVQLGQHHDLLGRALRAKQPVLVPQVGQDDLRSLLKAHEPASSDQLLICSALVVPLAPRNGPIGVLFLWRSSPHRPYTPDDQALATELAGRASLAIGNARLYQNEHEQAAAQAALNTSLRELADARDAALAEAAVATARLRFQSEASALLTSSLDYQETLRSVARLAVPQLADLCLVDIVAEDGRIDRVAVAAAIPSTQEVAERLRQYPPGPVKTSGVAEALRTGEPVLIREVRPALLDAIAQDSEHRDLLDALGFRSTVIAPLVARDRTLGAISFSALESGRVYGEDDVPMIEDLARRAAVAIDNARLHQAALNAVQVRDEFLTTVSHDLRIPLTSIVGQAQLLQRRLQGGSSVDAGRASAALAIIEAAAATMARLINESLDIAELQAGRVLRLTQSTVDLVGLPHRVVSEDLPPRCGPCSG